MLAKVTPCAVVGLDGALVDVEVDISNGMPGFTIVGLPDTAIQESRERVRAAIRNSSLTYPFNKRITVNLAPADLRKEGPAYDLMMEPPGAGKTLVSTYVPGTHKKTRQVLNLPCNISDRGLVRPHNLTGFPG